MVAVPWVLAAVVAVGTDVPNGQALTEPGEPNARPEATPAAPMLSERARNVALTEGAAAGYVDDQLCGRCHQDLFESYRDVGMSRSFSPPAEAEVIEDFEAPPYFHEPSRRYYEMRRTPDGTITFRRFQRDDAGREINEIEQQVDWVLGSGNRSRTYLFRTPGGELYQLPLAWYTQVGGWRMAPGFDKADHAGLDRRVQHECMFCHNAYPALPAGADAYLQPHHFPTALPHGIGCQRCHGPGGAHVQAGFADQVDFQALATSIVNPAALPREQQRDVCYQCHMQPSVSLMGIRRFGRAIYSFRPGEALGDYLAHVDVEEDGQAREERFEINHHPYRLEQSTCFQQSEGALSCLTCHDPHRKVAAAERAEHYRQACLSCHTVDACARDAMAAVHPGDPARVEANDCAGCHMPQRRTQDVIHAVMTDHRIARTHDGPALVAPREESTPIIVDAQPTDAHWDQAPALREVYRAIAVSRAGGGFEAGEWLDKHLAASKSTAFEPRLDLGRWRLRQKRFDEAAIIFESLLVEQPGDAVLTGLLALAHVNRGKPGQGLLHARRAVQLNPDRAEAHFNLGRILLGYGRPREAIEAFEASADRRPHHALSWYYWGEALSADDRSADAIEPLRQALRIDPGFTRAYLALGRALLAHDRRPEALRYLRHGARVADQPNAIAAALQAALETPKPHETSANGS